MGSFSSLNARNGLNKVAVCAAFLDLFFPNRCLLCSNRIPSSLFYCPKCAKELNELQPLPFAFSGKRNVTKTFAHSSYSSSLSKVIRAYKYSMVEVLADHLAFFLFQLIQYWGLQIQFLIPVPAHPASVRSRGFSNTLLICKRLQKHYLPDLILLQPIRRQEWNYRPQASLSSEEERKENVSGVFFLKKGTILPPKVFLFDDIYTSGATITALSQVLSPLVEELQLLVLAIKEKK